MDIKPACIIRSMDRERCGFRARRRQFEKRAPLRNVFLIGAMKRGANTTEIDHEDRHTGLLRYSRLICVPQSSLLGAAPKRQAIFRLTNKGLKDLDYVKQFGIQRSGTNIVKALIEENFDTRVLSIILGSKHHHFDAETARNWTPTPEIEPFLDLGAAELQRILSDFASGKIGCTLVIKNPHAWLRSTLRYRSYKAGAPVPFDTKFIKGNLSDWIKFNSDWLTNLPQQFPSRFACVSHHDLFLHPEQFLLTHEDALNLRRKRSDFVLQAEKAALAGQDRHRGFGVLSDQSFERDYYLKKRYMDEFTPGEMELVENILSDAPEILKPYFYDEA